MNDEEKQAIEYLKHSIFEYEEIDTSVKEYIDKNHKIIYKLLLNQQKQIKILKDNLVEERAFCKSTLETLKNCVDKDYLHKMISFKDGEIEKLKEAYQTLKDDIEGHRIAYVDTPEFEENYISKDKIREKLKKSKKEYEYYKKENLENLMRMTAGEIVMLEELLGE